MLSNNDNTVLSQIFDPEAAPSAGILVDAQLPNDPHILDEAVWSTIKQQEKSIIMMVETILKNKEPTSSLNGPSQDMKDLISSHPDCACLFNDYAQILRLLHGDDLVSGAFPDLTTEAYQNLTAAITLLTPPMPQAAISPAQCRTLAQAHTQRGALLHGLAKTLDIRPEQVVVIPSLEGFTAIEFQEAASRDFFMGGRYGNEIGKALAVHVNPTAKLCGQMVQNAMRQEYASA